jgi:hypothetical protein
MKRTIVATLMLATLGGCRMPDEGSDMPITRPAATGRTTRDSYYQGKWNKGDSDDDGETLPAPKKTVQTTRPSVSRTTTSAGRGYDSAYGKGDDGDLRLNDPATRDLIAATRYQTGSSTTARPASRSTQSQADSDFPPPRKSTYTYTYGHRPPILPAEMQQAALLDQGSPSATSLNSGRLTQTTGSTSLSRASKASVGKLSLVNSKHIRLRYAVDRVVTAGSSPIEVWGTRDMRSWKRYPVAADSGVRTAEGRSDTGACCLVEVEGEGVYGFTLCRTQGGSRAPQTGDTPQMWVAVDTTRPTVRLISHEVQDQDGGRKVVIRWTAQDANLGERPIALSYAAQPNGPWKVIAVRLANSGRYEWALPPQVAGFVHLRVQATDLMGNVGSADAAHPIFVHEREAGEGRSTPNLPPAINTQSASPTATAGEPAQPELMGASGDDH